MLQVDITDAGEQDLTSNLNAVQKHRKGVRGRPVGLRPQLHGKAALAAEAGRKRTGGRAEDLLEPNAAPEVNSD